MQHANDYERRTYEYLARYTWIRAYACTLDAELKNTVEMEETEHERSTKQAEHRAVVALLNQLDEAIAGLSEKERRIVQRKYIEGLPWKRVAGEIGYSPRSGQRYGKRAVQRIATSLFGEKARNSAKQLHNTPA